MSDRHVSPDFKVSALALSLFMGQGVIFIWPVIFSKAN